MKISNSKKELARIISENGGWSDGAEFTAQDKDGDVFKFDSKPVMGVSREVWMPTGNGCTDKLCYCTTIKGWHQTILSRAEYFHLYPAPDADGWIEWDKGSLPVGVDCLVDVKYENGTVECGFGAGGYDWNWKGDCLRIIAYRLHKPELAKSEFCESVMRSIPEPEAKPTIDQLLQDWRNADDFSKSKQAEADEAAAMRDERWNAVQARAGEFGVTVGLCKSAVGKEVEVKKFTGKFHSAIHGDRTSDLDMICDGCGKRFGTHVGFDCRP